MSKKSDEYKAVSNFFKNTAEISRKEIKEMLREVVQEAVKDELRRLFETRYFENIIARAISDKNYYSRELNKELQTLLTAAIAEQAKKEFANNFSLKFEPKN